MPNTPKVVLPYPAGTDPVAQGDNAIQALATALDDLLGSAWVAYTPALTSGGVQGNSTRTGAYRKVGKTVEFWARHVLGSTSTITAGPPILTLPVAAKSITSYASLQAGLIDTGTANYDAVATLPTVNGVSVWARSASGAYTVINAAAPFTWTTGDVIEVRGVYEAA